MGPERVADMHLRIQSGCGVMKDRTSRDKLRDVTIISKVLARAQRAEAERDALAVRVRGLEAELDKTESNSARERLGIEED